jgi:hypothetical protein
MKRLRAASELGRSSIGILTKACACMWCILLHHWSIVLAISTLICGILLHQFSITIPRIQPFYIYLALSTLFIAMLPRTRKAAEVVVSNSLTIVHYIQPKLHVYLIVTVSLGIVLAKMVFTNIKVDNVSVWLVAIAAVVLMFPKASQILKGISLLIPILPYLKKAKVPGFELELSDKIASLSKNLGLAEEKIDSETNLRDSPKFPIQRQEVLDSLKNDPKAALLLLAAQIEQQVRTQLEEKGIVTHGRYVPLKKAFAMGVDAGLFPEELRPAFDDFTEVRNQVAHGKAFHVEDSTILSLISMGTEILRIVSVERDNVAIHS